MIIPVAFLPLLFRVRFLEGQPISTSLSPSLSPLQAQPRLYGNPSHEGLHVVSTASSGYFQGFSELHPLGRPFLPPVQYHWVSSCKSWFFQAPLPQPFQHFQCWGSPRHCSQLSSLYSLSPSLSPLIPHLQGPQLTLVF